MAFLCDNCGRRFGGVQTFDRHFDRKRDRCKTDAHLRRIGIWKSANGLYVREPISDQPPLLDKRGLSPKPRSTRRGKALAQVGGESAPNYPDVVSGAPEPGERLFREGA